MSLRVIVFSLLNDFSPQLLDSILECSLSKYHKNFSPLAILHKQMEMQQLSPTFRKVNVFISFKIIGETTCLIGCNAFYYISQL